MKTRASQVISLAVTVISLAAAVVAAVALAPLLQQKHADSAACRSSAAGWVRFESAGKWTSPWIHIQTVTQCYSPDGQPSGPAQYVTWNGQTREWTKDRPADTNYVITPERPPAPPTGRTSHADPRTSSTP